MPEETARDNTMAADAAPAAAELDQESPEIDALHQLSWELLERWEWQLWAFAGVVICVLGGGLLSFMFPTAFWSSMNVMIRNPDRAFWGFGVLVVMAIAYLMERQYRIGKLRRELVGKLKSAVINEREAAIQSLQALLSASRLFDAQGTEHRSLIQGQYGRAEQPRRTTLPLRIPLHLGLNQPDGSSRELEAWTSVVNRHGAMVECTEAVPAGTELAVTVLATGQRSTGRVIWSNPARNPRGYAEFAVAVPQAEELWAVSFPMRQSAA